MSKNDPYSSLKYLEFRYFLLVRFALVLAWTMQFIIIEWMVYSITKDPISLGLIGLVEIVPALSMALFAGHIVDQKEKKGMLFKCILAFSCVSLCLFLVTTPFATQTLSQNQQLFFIYSFVFFGGIIRSFIGPSNFSLMALIVPKKEYSNAATWSSSVWQIGAVGGPALGGLAIHIVGVHWSLCFVLACAIIAFISLFGISKKPIVNQKNGDSIKKSLKEGLKFVFETKAILYAISLDMVAVLFGGAVALLPIYAQDILHVGSKGFGFLRSAPAIGALVTLFLTAYFPVAKNAGKKFLIAIFVFGLSIIAFGLSTSFWMALIALFLSGIADGISVVVRQTILQLKTPDNMRGRVASVNMMFVGSSNELGAFESGMMAKLIGPVATVVVGGSITLITVVATAIGSSKFRKLDLRKDIEEHQLKV